MHLYIFLILDFSIKLGHDAVDKVNLKTSQLGDRSVICKPNTFFQPSKVIPLLSNLSLLEGDMFFSRAQTLTISVNTVSVMGKGVASRAKWQFSDVYVNYQYNTRFAEVALEWENRISINVNTLPISNSQTTQKLSKMPILLHGFFSSSP